MLVNYATNMCLSIGTLMFGMGGLELILGKYNPGKLHEPVAITVAVVGVCLLALGPILILTLIKTEDDNSKEEE
ncbi:hypothetical protein ACPV37_07010 [Vibrio mediterranei]